MTTGKNLLKWYHKNKRDLPWRKSSDPYLIWISEVMLQQTTVQAVQSYYKKFIKKFPTLKSLAKSSSKDVLSYWSGLGYYSRARNLHRSAQMFFNLGTIPKTAQELQKYPGFGPYTAKAVSSIAFGESVSVVDGNVIRVLCRHEGLSIQWWKHKKRIESIADRLRNNLPSGDFNQALMELGAVICTPQNPSCFICPIQKTCQAFKLQKIDKIPLKKPRKTPQILLWTPKVIIKNKKVLLTQNHSCPFLKNQWLFPGRIQKRKIQPKKYAFRHSITCYNIFVNPQKSQSDSFHKGVIWQSLNSISTVSPFSLTQKVLAWYQAQ